MKKIVSENFSRYLNQKHFENTKRFQDITLE